MKSVFIAFPVIFCLLSLQVFGTIYYVSPQGSDGNSGKTSAQAWKTISKINAKVFKSDTILFQGGQTFYGSLYFDKVDLGTQSKPIVVGSYGTGKATIKSDTAYGLFIYNTAGIEVKNLVFSGIDRLTNKRAGIIIYLDRDSTWLSYLKLDNLEVYGYKNAGISIGNWGQRNGFKNISITNSIVHDNGKAGIETYAAQPYTHTNLYIGYTKTYNNSGLAENTVGHSGSGIMLGGVNVAKVEYCTSYNNGWLHKVADSGGPIGIWAYQSDSVTFQYNESHHNKTGTTKDGGGFDFDGGCTNSIMQYNYAHDNDGAGYILTQYGGPALMSNITVRYNITENDSRKGDQGVIHLWAASGSTGIKTVDIYNNTVFVKPSANAVPSGFFIRSGPVSGVKVRNNIFQTTGAVQLVRVPSNTSGCVMQGNSYWSSGSTFKVRWGATTYSSLAAWSSATGQEKVNGTASGIQADAQFADTTTGVTFNDPQQLTNLKRYKLKSASALVDKGLNLKALFGTNIGTRDFWGNSLANKTTFHIGAYQGTPVAAAAASVITMADRKPVMHDAAAVSGPYKELSLQVYSAPGQHHFIIYFAAAKDRRLSIALYNVHGQLIKGLFSGAVQAGVQQQIRVANELLSNGVYIVRMEEGKAAVSKKAVVNR
jgi:hypothetical protein